SESSGAGTTRLLDNGHLLRYAKLTQQAFGDGPGAAGHVQEFDWDGHVVWDFKYASAKQLGHHDIFKMPNGNVLMIVWEKKSPDEAVAAGRRAETVGKGNLLPDCIIEVKPEGKSGGQIVWEWHVWDHLVQDHDQSKANYGDVKAHPELIDVNFGEGAMASIVAKKEELDKLRAIGYVGAATPGKPARVQPDWLHCNAVAYNEDLDQILLNSPEFNELWIIDHSTTTDEAASHAGGRSGKGGDLLYRWGNPRAYRAGTVKDQKLFYQHNAHFIPKGLPGAGHVLIFNNGKRRPGGAHSSVDELVLPVDADGRYAHQTGTAYGPDQPIWSYSAPKKSEFYSEFISGAHRLPNGNTFVCSGPSGTIFEVTPDKEIVWKYVNPAKIEGPPPVMPALVDILPAFLRDTLKTTEEQAKQFDELRKETEVKLQALLNEEQKKVLKEPPRGGGGPGSQAVSVLPAFLRPRLKLADDQKKQLEALQKEAEAKLDKTLTADQRKQLKDIRDGFFNAFGGGPPGGGGGGGPPGLGSAVFRSYRYAANYAGLSGKDLTPGKTIEELQAKEPEKK
ncbi:MAG TPA: aryl-sulfate sulfotransferase, partial [Gemmataceae bacterium]|nr:aryl-sulfate sulfotransferase [Gemmataceae bacterium]